MPNSNGALRKIFLSGLLLILPAGLTVLLLNFIIGGVDRVIDPVIVYLLRLAGARIQPDFHIPGMGFALVLVAIFLIGLATRNFLGNALLHYWNELVARIPFVRSIYLTAKKIIDTVTLTDSPTFQQVALVDYPREGLKSLGVVSCDARGEIVHRFGGDMVGVFVPTTPNPTTGFLVFLPREKIIPLNLSVDKGFKMIISVGMYNPPGEPLPPENQTKGA